MKKYSVPLEKDIQAKIMAYLKTVPGLFAWKAHTGGIYAAAGIPDVLCVYNGRLFAFEVKRPGRKPTALQQATIESLQAAGAVAVVVTGVGEVKEVINSVGKKGSP